MLDVSYRGVWKLVSSELKQHKTGEVHYPYGRNPTGRIIYDAKGRMSVHMMDPERRSVGGPPNRTARAVAAEASPTDLRDILTGFNAYFGTYEIEESSETVIHHLQGCLIPSWVGADLRRKYQFSGSDRLVLDAVSNESVIGWSGNATFDAHGGSCLPSVST